MAKKTQVDPNASLFEQLFAANEETLANQNKEFLGEELKMAIRAGVNAARREVNSHKQALNKLRADLEGYNLEAILDVKAEIAGLEAEIASAKEEYATMFGEDMPDTI